MTKLTNDELAAIRERCNYLASHVDVTEAELNWWPILVDEIDALKAHAEELQGEVERLKNSGPEANEIRCVGKFNRLNGWETGQIAQRMGADLKDQIKPGWKFVRGEVRVSIWLAKQAIAGEEES